MAPKKMTEVDALLEIAKALNRLADAAEIMASPPPQQEAEHHEHSDQTTDED